MTRPSVIADVPLHHWRAECAALSNALLARKYGVHPSTAAYWRKQADAPPWPSGRRQVSADMPGQILALFAPGVSLSAKEICQATGYVQLSVNRVVRRLAAQGHLRRTGTVRHYRYSLPEGTL